MLSPTGLVARLPLTVIKHNKKHADARTRDGACADAVQLLTSSILRSEEFAASNSVEDADRIDDRLETSLDEGYTMDEQLILPALHAGQIASEIAARIDVGAA